MTAPSLAPANEVGSDGRMLPPAEPWSLPRRAVRPGSTSGDQAPPGTCDPTLIKERRAGGPSRLQVAAVAGDLCVLLGSYIALVEHSSVGIQTSQLGMWCAALAGVWLAVALNLGAYRHSSISRALHSPYLVAKITVIATPAFHLLPLVGGPTGPRLESIGVIFAQVLALGTWRFLLARLAPVVAVPVELVIIGAGWAGRTLADAIATERSADMRVVAFVEDDPALVGTRLSGLSIHPPRDLSRLVQGPTGLRRVVLAIEEEAHAAIFDELTAIAEAGVEIVSMAGAYEQVTGRIPVRHLGNRWWASLPRPSASLVYLLTKRAVDLIGSFVGLAILALTLPVLTVLLRRETRGSLFLTQIRLGQHDKAFRVVKLRTLPTSSSTHADLWERKRANQPARLGAMLRTIGIDELPQCLNILKGEMSLVGPRPYVPEEVAEYQRRIPFFRSRALVKPGITGWAQVNWGYGLSLTDEIEKLQYDLYYVGHQSFYLDLLILLRTASWVFKGRTNRLRVSKAVDEQSPRVTIRPTSARREAGPELRPAVFCEPSAIFDVRHPAHVERWAEIDVASGSTEAMARLASLNTTTVLVTQGVGHGPGQPPSEALGQGPLQQAAEDLGLDLTRSMFVGASLTEVSAARAAGCRAILVGRPDSASFLPGDVACAPTFMDAIDFILADSAFASRRTVQEEEQPIGSRDEERPDIKRAPPPHRIAVQ